ncbi:UNVERIFIED_CONTAM: ABC-2 type transport system ATP-binding protein [Acetivibrio alkalicellulosi]
MSIISISGLVKRFGNVIAVDNLNLNIAKNELFGLLGANGAGKSTTIKILSGLLKPNSGSVHIAGMNISTNAFDIKKIIGVIPQDLAIYENISARENIEFFARLYGVRGKTLNTMVNNALEFVGLFDNQNEKPKSFSGGMKRKLNMACSIVHNPEIIIMDEPTVGIDTHSRNQILESVKKLKNQGTTIIYTTHYIDEAEDLCDRVGIIDKGKLIACGSKEELKNLIKSKESIIIDTLHIEQQSIEEIKKLQGVLSIIYDNNYLNIDSDNLQSNLQDILFILFKNNVDIKNISIKKASLESVYLKLTGKNMRY